MKLLHSSESSGKPQRRRITWLIRFSNKDVDSHFLDVKQPCLMLVCKTENINSFIHVLARTMVENILGWLRLLFYLLFPLVLSQVGLVFSESHFSDLHRDFLCLFFPAVISPSIFQLQFFRELFHIFHFFHDLFHIVFHFFRDSFHTI